MSVLTPDKAYAYLDQAAAMNPGFWVAHSKYTAKAARLIAAAVGLDPNQAEAFGAVHDIGRRVGVVNTRHAIEGYRFLSDLGYDDAAGICLTHGFPTRNLDDAPGVNDCNPKDWEFMRDFLKNRNYTLMDRLISLSDVLTLPSGFTVIERRLIDVALRYGVDARTTNVCKAYIKIQVEFEELLGRSIYSVLPEVKENVMEKKLCEVLKMTPWD